MFVRNTVVMNIGSPTTAAINPFRKPHPECSGRPITGPLHPPGHREVFCETPYITSEIDIIVVSGEPDGISKLPCGPRWSVDEGTVVVISRAVACRCSAHFVKLPLSDQWRIRRGGDHWNRIGTDDNIIKPHVTGGMDL